MYRSAADSVVTVGSGGCGTVLVVWLALSTFIGCGLNLQPLGAIKATVTGLKGSGLELWMNGHDPVPVEKDGEVTLAYMARGYYYSVTVRTQPTSPAQTCTVANATGVLDSADVTNVTVTCVATYGIGGTVSGLEGTGLILNNGLGDNAAGEDLAISENGTFIFPTRAVAQTEYVVSVKNEPTLPGQICSVEENASGTVTDSDILNVKVTCSTNAYKVGGMVKNLAAGTTLVLRNNGVDLPVPNNNAAASDVDFSFMVADGAAYAVTVETQPTNPWQECSVDTGTGSGRVNGQDVMTVGVTCKINSYSIVGSISGLAGHGLILTTNGEELPVDAGSTIFLFKNRLPSLTVYDIKVKTQPTDPKQVCSVENGAGMLSDADALNVLVTCVSFVIVGTNAAATSPDGLRWDQRTVPSGQYNAITWNGSFFIAIGDKTVASSPDGIHWESESIAGGPFHAITWNGSLFSAVGNDVAATSPDGIHWTQKTISGIYRDIIWNGVAFIAIGDCGIVPSDCSVIASSSDGDVWSTQDCKAPQNGHYYKIAWDGVRLVAGGEETGEFTNVGRLAVSTDCVKWTVSDLASATIPSITPGIVESVVWNGSAWLVTGNFSGGYTSTDGSAWSWIPYTEEYPMIAWSGDRFAAVSRASSAGSSTLSTSSDGKNWTVQATLSGVYNAIIAVDGH